MPGLVEPHYDQAIDNQRNRRSTFDRLGQSIRRVFQPQELFAILEGAFNRCR